MRLALIVRTLGTHGGTERFVHGLSAHLVAAGHAVDVWCAAAEDIPPGVQARPLAVRARGRAWRLWALHRAALRVPRDDYDLVASFVRGGQPDLYRAGGGCHAAYLARTGRWGLAEQVELALDRAVVQAARRVIANSRMAAGELQAHYGLPPERVRLIYNGVDAARFQPLTGAARADVVGFLGTGYARKGLEVVLGALVHLPGVRLEVAGREPHLARYQRLAARLGVAERVVWRGALAQPEAWLPGLGALVLPTRYDPFANVCLEALACGVPVVTTAANGAAELLPEAWLVAEGAEATAAALERALQTPSLRPACRAAAEAHPAAHAFTETAAVMEELHR